MGASTFTIETTNIILGSSVKINITSSSDSYRNELDLVMFTTFGNVRESIWNGNTQSLKREINWTVDFNRYLNWFSDRFKCSWMLVLRTYDESGTELNPFQQTNIIVSLDESIVPTVQIYAIDNVPRITDKFSSFVQLESNLKISISANGVHGSTVKSCKITFEDSVYTNLYLIEHGTINGSGSIPITATITDSRGRSNTQTLNINVLPYSPPKIKNFVGYRANSDGSQSENSTKTNNEIGFEISPLNNLNNNSYKIYYKAKDAETWSESGIAGNAYSMNNNFVSNPIFALDVAYDVRLEITDFFHTSNAIIDIAEAYTLIDINGSGRGLAFGKVSDWEDGVEFDIKTKFSKGVAYPILETGTDLNSLNVSNTYKLSSSNSYANSPENDVEAILYVDGEEFIRQRVFVFNTASALPYEKYVREYERIYYNNKWGVWVDMKRCLEQDMRMFMWENILDAAYPIGSVYFESNANAPDDIFGGTWEQLSSGIPNVNAWKRTG